MVPGIAKCSLGGRGEGHKSPPVENHCFKATLTCCVCWFLVGSVFHQFDHQCGILSFHKGQPCGLLREGMAREELVEADKV